MAATAAVPLADYLFRRLGQLGVGSVHGVPGDYNLTLLDHVQPCGLRWVGNANELNAAYAADAYARIKGLSAVVTTFGVGELSAINAIAGAYTERAAVVHIVGIPIRAAVDGRRLIHHTFNDGEYGRFAKMAAHVTVAQERLLDPRTAPAQIDAAIAQCLRHSRPVYIEVPVDLVAAPVDGRGLESALDAAFPPPSNREGIDAAVQAVLARVRAARQPVIYFDGEIRPMGVIDEVQRISAATGWPTWTSSFGKSLLDESASNYHGIYEGSFGSAEAKSFIDAADLVLFFGPHLSSTNTFAYASIPAAAATVYFTDTEVKVGDGPEAVHRDVPANHVISQLAEYLCAADNAATFHRYDSYPQQLPRPYTIAPSDVPSGDLPLAQDRLWRVLASFLRPGDIVMGETGTAGYGVREMLLPKNVRSFTPVTWLSIGYMLPGAQGAALAQRELVEESKWLGAGDSKATAARLVLFIGDGSFQMTAQEVATIIRLGLDVVIFLLNNDGYAIERCIHGRNQDYNDVSSWRYLEAPSFFGADEGTYTARASSWAELQGVLADERLSDGKGLRMVELIGHKEDAPRGPLLDLLAAQKAREAK